MYHFCNSFLDIFNAKGLPFSRIGRINDLYDERNRTLSKQTKVPKDDTHKYSLLRKGGYLAETKRQHYMIMERLKCLHSFLVCVSWHKIHKKKSSGDSNHRLAMLMSQEKEDPIYFCVSSGIITCRYRSHNCTDTETTLWLVTGLASDVPCLKSNITS